MISDSGQPRNLAFEENHISGPTFEASDRLIIFQYSHQDLTIREQSVIEEPHHHGDIPLDPIIQLSQQENVDITLKRSDRIRNLQFLLIILSTCKNLKLTLVL